MTNVSRVLPWNELHAEQSIVGETGDRSDSANQSQKSLAHSPEPNVDQSQGCHPKPSGREVARRRRADVQRRREEQERREKQRRQEAARLAAARAKQRKGSERRDAERQAEERKKQQERRRREREGEKERDRQREEQEPEPSEEVDPTTVRLRDLNMSTNMPRFVNRLTVLRSITLDSDQWEKKQVNALHL